ncbi:TPA: ABC transporter substrate-binding protein [Elizabethkingia meningoseptica]|uniref:ABC transporter substrate-binding protein n=1 Tax=Elizabethkingia meningoseptica TaxID=238 RepID=UPI0022F16048|nr:helical backbone metal receptor [Elizabethkingia meningoseptica]EJK5329665.1 ABC transporter substrate-binding protein [Elizabethkingia meningoseptica]WBS75510.1 helical backbone metal receptor [Elizabethkingia meningoseptica]HAY3563248.1 ABC transporter substrate-binding protein [Elizabethkingia meningoseptica]HAY3564573.1 ABC transporter substrate-binding protein [Elizabethkingia meningoseptica]
MRIVSLVPSLTESLLDFGIQNIVGRTKFCIHPKELVSSIEIIGGTKNLHLEKIQQLQPDLILANKEENTKEQVEILMQNFNVWLTNIENIEDNYYFLKNLGNMFNQKEKAQSFNLKIYDIFNTYKLDKKMKAAYLIWKNPYMTIGSDTFIHHILHQLGFENIFSGQKRYPVIEMQDLQEADVIMLSSEPYPFKEKHIEEFRAIYPDKKIMIVDGEAFSWYGTHIAKCEAYYKELVTTI